MYDTSSQDEITSISVQDSDCQWFSLDTTYHVNTQSNIDFGFTYLVREYVDVDENGILTGITRADAILVGLQYSRKF